MADDRHAAKRARDDNPPAPQQLPARGPRISIDRRAPFAPVPVDAATRSAVQQLALELVFGGGAAAQARARRHLGERPELPGPLPASLSRRSLARQLTAHAYMVCEKSDGERAFLLAQARPHARTGAPAGCFLLDRSFAVQSIGARGAEYASFLAPAGPTLLDGELIVRADDAGTGTGARAVFMVFDCAACNGRDLAGSGAPLDARLACVRDGVRAPFTAADARCLAEGAPLLPLYLCGKFMVDKSHVRAILDRVGLVAGVGASTGAGIGAGAGGAGGAGDAGGAGGAGGSASGGAAVTIAPIESEMGTAGAAAAQHGATLRIYRHDIRVNGTDGLIFTPNAPSYRQLFDTDCATPLLKWKYLDEITVDFEMAKEALEDSAGELDAGGARGASTSASGGASTGAGAGSAHSPARSTARIPLHVGGLDKGLAYCELSRTQIAAYDALCRRLNLDSLIVECAFSPADSLWTIRRVRDRKRRPNFVTTAWATLESVAEALTAEELIARLAK